MLSKYIYRERVSKKPPLRWKREIAKAKAPYIYIEEEEDDDEEDNEAEKKKKTLFFVSFLVFIPNG